MTTTTAKKIETLTAAVDAAFKTLEKPGLSCAEIDAARAVLWDAQVARARAIDAASAARSKALSLVLAELGFESMAREAIAKPEHNDAHERVIARQLSRGASPATAARVRELLAALYYQMD